MSDILIRGMEMPEKCGVCPCFTAEQGAETCNPLDRNVDGEGQPEPDCPLHELPPHGDLIDANALKEKSEYDRKHLEITGYERELLWHYLDVSMAPVIVPASEEGG